MPPPPYRPDLVGGPTSEQPPLPTPPGKRPSAWWLLLGAAAVTVAVVVLTTSASHSPHGSSSPTTSTTTAPTTRSTAHPGGATSTTTIPLALAPRTAQVSACQADARTVESALAAYQAVNGTYPVPPAPWTTDGYTSDYAPLTAPTNGGPFLHNAPGTHSYVIEYDGSGHVWISPPGSYPPSYVAGQSFDANPNICLAAVG